MGALFWYFGTPKKEKLERKKKKGKRSKEAFDGHLGKEFKDDLFLTRFNHQWDNSSFFRSKGMERKQQQAACKSIYEATTTE